MKLILAKIKAWLEARRLEKAIAIVEAYGLTLVKIRKSHDNVLYVEDKSGTQYRLKALEKKLN